MNTGDRREETGGGRAILLLCVLLAPGCSGGATTQKPPATGNAEKGQDLYLAGQFETAEAELRGAVQRDPKDVLARRLLGRVLLLRNQTREAADQLGQAVNLTKDKHQGFDPMAMQDYVGALYRMDDFARLSEWYGNMHDVVLHGKYKQMSRLTPPYTASWRGGAASMPSERGPVPVFEMRVNGASGAFSIDTSAGELVLDNKFAKSAGAKVMGSTSRTMTGALTEGYVDMIDAPGLQLRTVPVVMRDLQPIGARHVIGVLGANFLMHFQTTIDFRAERVTLRPMGAPARERGQALPLYIAGDHHFIVRAEIDGKPALLVLHTGLVGRSFVPSQAYIAQRVREEKRLPTAENPLLKEVRLGPVKLVARDDPADFPGGLDTSFGFVVAGLVGPEAFRGRAVTIDVERMKLVME